MDKEVKVKEYLLIETDDACAMCGVRGKDNLTEHHIDGNRKNNSYENRIILCHNCQHRYHQDKGISREDIEGRKRRLIAKTLTQYGVNALRVACRGDGRIYGMTILLQHLVDLGFLKKKEIDRTYDDIEVDACFAITKKGRRLYEKWLK